MSRPWILLPVHQRRELTLRCLRHLAETRGDAGATVAVIDAASADGTAAAVQGEFPHVRLLSVSADHWWTGAIAHGMRAAAAAGAPAVLWLNDDCLPDSGCVALLLAGATARSPVILGATCRDDLDRPVKSAFVGRKPLSAPPSEVANAEVSGLSGFCVAVPRAAWIKLGFPDARRFPHYAGDTAYTIAASRAGMPVRLSGNATARLSPYHERAHTIGDFLRRQPVRARTWGAVFLGHGSPFRAATQLHYLRLRYGTIAGTVLAAARIGIWQLAFIAAAKGEARGSATGP